ncbi:hypothetical protein, partial [Pseudoneobacillus sp. C159]
VIIGIRNRDDSSAHYLYNGQLLEKVSAISPYLTSGDFKETVHSLNKHINGLPGAFFGSMPRDGGYLLL